MYGEDYVSSDLCRGIENDWPVSSLDHLVEFTKQFIMGVMRPKA